MEHEVAQFEQAQDCLSQIEGEIKERVWKQTRLSALKTGFNNENSHAVHR